MKMMAAKVAPSISAAAMIMLSWMVPAISGCRAIPLHGRGRQLADSQTRADDGQGPCRSR